MEVDELMHLATNISTVIHLLENLVQSRQRHNPRSYKATSHNSIEEEGRCLIVDGVFTEWLFCRSC